MEINQILKYSVDTTVSTAHRNIVAVFLPVGQVGRYRPLIYAERFIIKQAQNSFREKLPQPLLASACRACI